MKKYDENNNVVDNDDNDFVVIAHLAEECAEVIQICSKIIRFGFDSHHPKDPKKRINTILLKEELDDIQRMVKILENRGIL